jgi:hypothetical protein
MPRRPNSGILLFVVAGVAGALGACSGSKPAQANGEAREAPRTGQSSTSRNGEVVIAGAVTKRYAPREVGSVKIGDQVGININEKEDNPCGVSLHFPGELQPGTYEIEDRLHAMRNVVVVQVTAEYGAFCNENGGLSDTYQSTKGTLTLTAAGARFSGSFQFAAGQIKDESRTVQVSGSFSDVPRP